MPESNLPSGTADGGALSFDDGVSAIENLDLGSDLPNPEKQVEATNEADTPDDELEVDAATDDTEGAEEADGPDEVGKGGKFVSNDAKVTLNDGTVTTVEALKRGFMSQQSFTRSTQEVSETRKALEAEKATVSQTAQALAKQRDFILQAAQALLPQEPQPDDNDPWGYMQKKHAYDQQMRVVNQILYQSQTEKQRLSQEEEQAKNSLRQTEARRLWEAVPEFRDRKVYDQFWSDASRVMVEEYGFTEQDLADTIDHRMYKAMRDLVKYQAALKRAKTVKQDIQQKPQLMSDGRRMDPKAKISRQAQTRSENLRKTGSFEAGVAALMDLDL